MKRYRDAALLFSFCALIYWLSDQPVPQVPMFFPHQDKLHHGAAYALLGILAWRYFSRCLHDRPAVAVVSLLFCLLYGLGDELHQSRVPSRSADFLDWAADAAGAGLAIALFLLRPKEPQLQAATGD